VSAVEVQDWTKEAKSFSPTMTVDVDAPAQTALDALAAGLTSQGFRVKDATPTGFRASYRELIGGLLGLVTASDFDILNRTLLTVAASPTTEGVRLVISVAGGGQHRAGRNRGTSGLTAGLQDLQRRGFGLAATPWQRPERGTSPP
jgi:hypothetical protein